MSNTVVNHEVPFIYDLHRLLALFVTLFQTARTLYFLCFTRVEYSLISSLDTSYRTATVKSKNLISVESIPILPRAQSTVLEYSTVESFV